MDPYGVPSRRSHHGQWGGTRGGGLTPAGHGPSRSGKSSSVAVRWGLSTGLMITVAMAVAKGAGLSISPMAIVIGSAVVCVAGLVAVVVIAHRTPINDAR